MTHLYRFLDPEDNGERTITLVGCRRLGPNGPEITARAEADGMDPAYAVYWLVDGRWARVTPAMRGDEYHAWTRNRAAVAYLDEPVEASDELDRWLSEQLLGAAPQP